MRRAAVRVKAGLFAGGAEDCTAVLKATQPPPPHVPALSLRSAARRSMGEFGAALEDADEVLSLAADTTVSHLRIGAILCF